MHSLFNSRRIIANHLHLAGPELGLCKRQYVCVLSLSLGQSSNSWHSHSEFQLRTWDAYQDSSIWLGRNSYPGDTEIHPFPRLLNYFCLFCFVSWDFFLLTYSLGGDKCLKRKLSIDLCAYFLEVSLYSWIYSP